MMNIAVLGTGMVGRAIAGRLEDLGHSVVVGTRDPQATLARTEPDQVGNASFVAWHEAHAGVELATFADAAAAWLHHLEHVEGCKPSTRHDYRYALATPDTPARWRGCRG